MGPFFLLCHCHYHWPPLPPVMCGLSGGTTRSTGMVNTTGRSAISNTAVLRFVLRTGTVVAPILYRLFYAKQIICRFFSGYTKILAFMPFSYCPVKNGIKTDFMPKSAYFQTTFMPARDRFGPFLCPAISSRRCPAVV